MERRCTELGLEPAAILLTHGHLDHGGDAHLLGERYQIPTFCHAADQPMLIEPALGLGEAFAGALQMWQIGTLPEPRDLQDYPEAFETAGLRVTVQHAPGHTEGSVLLELRDDQEHVILTGDVLFKGSIGRTDLPGGSMDQMRRTLTWMVRETPRDPALLPGHGPGTTMAAEVATNPYLSADFLKG